jgi:hypothetical protein
VKTPQFMWRILQFARTLGKAPGSHRTERDSLPSLRSSHLIGLGSVTQAQWANMAGCLSSSPFHHRLARLCDLSRLNFRRAQRIR